MHVLMKLIKTNTMMEAGPVSSLLQTKYLSEPSKRTDLSINISMTHYAMRDALTLLPHQSILTLKHHARLINMIILNGSFQMIKTLSILLVSLLMKMVNASNVMSSALTVSTAQKKTMKSTLVTFATDGT